MDTRAMRQEHRVLIDGVSRLGAAARALRTRGDAEGARARILMIDADLRAHLGIEDTVLYPALIRAGDADIQALGLSARADMSGLVGAWLNYREHWTVGTILGDPARFAAATEGLIGALSLRIEMENDILYPAMDVLSAGRLPTAA